ncbi:helix-turn-helix domain-containing protein [Nonomuraea salmonea]|uniref:Helix-turn-helix domain-containing protein n=1 Tax=Nonomuraea salmonea TaxID=46181 RepID=A0ABV5P4B7_9ACTN
MCSWTSSTSPSARHCLGDAASQEADPPVSGRLLGGLDRLRFVRSTDHAALVLCAEQGYARTTVEGIAARAGVSKKTIYR